MSCMLLDSGYKMLKPIGYRTLYSQRKIDFCDLRLDDIANKLGQ